MKTDTPPGVPPHSAPSTRTSEEVPSHEGIIEFSDWAKLDLRVAQIKKVEEIKGADKLWKLTLDVGSVIGKRIVCAGLKEYYSKEELEGKKVIVFVNLAPRKMRGIESQGMILAASNEDHSVVKLILPDGDIELGSRVS